MLEDISFKPGQRVRATYLQRMAEAIRMLLNISAAPPLRVTVSANGLFLSMSDPPASSSVFDAKVMSSAAINGLIRYSYQVEFGHWDMDLNVANGGSWTTDDDNSGTGYTAFNSAEDMNVGTGSGLTGTLTIGTGVTAKQSDGTVAGSSCVFKQIPTGAYVQVKDRGTNPNGSGNYYYTIINFANSAS